MAHYLVIVESPAKVKTIKKFLGSNYTVTASQGHVRDLPKSQLGIDVDNDYEPKYITIRGKGDILATLRKEAKKSDKVFLATDPDREGEAISWHLATALKLDEKKMRRITFNEITKNAVKASLKNPRDIDMNLVDAQQARRVLDRLVGYKISPLLWEKVKRGLSAGRVQSVALRMICDREEEINAFIPEEYWNLDAAFKFPGSKKPLMAKFYGNKEGRVSIGNKEEIEKIQNYLKKQTYVVVQRQFLLQAVETHPKVQRSGDRADAECGRTAAFRHGPPDAGQLGVSRDAEPERHRPRGTGEDAEHLRQPAGLCHQRPRRLRADSLRREYCAFYQQFPEGHQAVQPDDNQAGRTEKGVRTWGITTKGRRSKGKKFHLSAAKTFVENEVLLKFACIFFVFLYTGFRKTVTFCLC